MALIMVMLRSTHSCLLSELRFSPIALLDISSARPYIQDHSIHESMIGHLFLWSGTKSSQIRKASGHKQGKTDVIN